MYFKKHSLEIDLVINFKSNFEEKKISLFLMEEDSTFILSKEKIQFINQFPVSYTHLTLPTSLIV